MFRKMRMMSLLAGVALASSLLGTKLAAAGGRQYDVHGTFVGSGDLTVWSCTGTGRFTTLGLSQVSLQIGTLGIVATSGDTLTLSWNTITGSLQGNVLSIGIPTLTVTGGTGRLQGAQGLFSLQASEDLNTGAVNGILRGTLVLPTGRP